MTVWGQSKKSALLPDLKKWNYHRVVHAELVMPDWKQNTIPVIFDPMAVTMPVKHVTMNITQDKTVLYEAFSLQVAKLM